MVSINPEHDSKKRHLECLFLVAVIFWHHPVIANVNPPASIVAAGCLHDATASPISIASVTDGDTVVLNDGRSVRLIGINTLELTAPQAQERAWALAAKRELENHIQLKHVFLITEIDEFDRYGRTLGHLQFDDGSSAAQILISKGLGLSVSIGANQRCAHQYAQTERLAKRSKLGLWQNLENRGSDSELTRIGIGFRLITSAVVDIYGSANRTTLTLENGLIITLNTLFHAASHYTSTQIQHLLGVQIEVRGWLGKKSDNYHLTLSHPANLRLPPY